MPPTTTRCTACGRSFALREQIAWRMSLDVAIAAATPFAVAPHFVKYPITCSACDHYYLYDCDTPLATA